MKCRALGTTLFVFAFWSSVAHAERTPEPLWAHVNLTLQLDTVAPNCPSHGDVTAWVNELAGWDFAWASAPVEVTIRVADTSNNELTVDVLSTEPTEAGVERKEWRHFQSALSCAELVRAAALTISLLAKPPEPRAEVQPEGTSSDVIAEPLTAPNDGAQQVGMEQSNAPLGNAERSVASIQHGTVLQPGSARQPPLPTYVPAPSSTPEPSPELPSTTEEASVSGGNADARTQFGESSEVGAIVGASATGALGMNPGVGLGASAHLGLSWPSWQLLLRGGYLASTGQKLRSSEQGRIVGPTSELFLAACPVPAGVSVFHSEPVLRLCAFGGAVWVFARGEGFARDRSDDVTTVAMGASAELLLRVSESLAFTVKLDALLPLKPVTYRLVGESSAGWTMWAIAPRLSVGMEWR